MSMFRRRNRDEAGDPDADGSPDAASLEPDGTESPDAVGGEPAPARWRASGPWDVSEVDDPGAGGRVDLGGMWIPGRQGLEVRVEADQSTGQVVAVTLVLAGGALQVQPFAAPRTEDIWDEVRSEIRAGITKQGGTADEVLGPLGTELRTRVPVRAQDGSSDVAPARFVGVDGPRWFLRGVLTGPVATQDGGDAELIELFRDIVVVRGQGPMAPRDPIPLALPAAVEQDAPGEGEPGDRPVSQGDLRPFERGPEITEIH